MTTIPCPYHFAIPTGKIAGADLHCPGAGNRSGAGLRPASNSEAVIPMRHWMDGTASLRPALPTERRQGPTSALTRGTGWNQAGTRHQPSWSLTSPLRPSEATRCWPRRAEPARHGKDKHLGVARPRATTTSVTNVTTGTRHRTSGFAGSGAGRAAENEGEARDLPREGEHQVQSVPAGLG